MLLTPSPFRFDYLEEFFLTSVDVVKVLYIPCQLLDLGPEGVWESTNKLSAKSVGGIGPFCKK